jgi:RNA polymerase sigma factor (sigma-70 family)
MKIATEYKDLKRIIVQYKCKVETPNRERNDISLNKLDKIKTDDPKWLVNKEYLKIRNDLALSNGGFAMKYVIRYINVLSDNSCVGDMFQEAMLGVVETIDAFDVKLGVSFTTYAYFHVKKRLIDFIKQSKIVRAPKEIARNLRHVSLARENLKAEFKREPSLKELKTYLWKENQIKLEPAIIDQVLLLLDLNSGEHDQSLTTNSTDQVGYLESNSLAKRLESNVLKDINKLDDKTKKYVTLRFGVGEDYPHTPPEINLITGISILDESQNLQDTGAYTDTIDIGNPLETQDI